MAAPYSEQPATLPRDRSTPERSHADDARVRSCLWPNGAVDAVREQGSRQV
jgi:hypothetical protein